MCLSVYCVGVATRAIGIIPEKALIMQTGLCVQHYMNRNNEGSSYFNSIVAGGFAGVATTVAGLFSHASYTFIIMLKTLTKL